MLNSVPISNQKLTRSILVAARIYIATIEKNLDVKEESENQSTAEIVRM